MNDSYVGLGIVGRVRRSSRRCGCVPASSRRHWLAFALGMPLMGGLPGLRAGLEVGRRVRDRRPRHPRPGPQRARPAAPARRAGPADDGARATSRSRSPEGQSGGNYVYLAIMVALILIAVLANVLHPVAWTAEELRFAVGVPIALGAVAIVYGLSRGDAAAADHRRLERRDAGRARVRGPPGRRGPVHAVRAPRPARLRAARACPRTPDDPAAMLDPPGDPPIGWLRLGAGWGLPALWLVVGLVVIPLGLYVLSYLPWAMRREPPDRRGLAARAHRPDAARPHGQDVHVPQQPQHAAPGLIALVGVDPRPEARVVLRGGLRRPDLGLDLRRGQPGGVVARHPRPRLHVLAA